MTSQLLKKLQTILSSTLRRTEPSVSGRGGWQYLVRFSGMASLGLWLVAAGAHASDDPAASGSVSSARRVIASPATWSRTVNEDGNRESASAPAIQDASQSRITEGAEQRPEFARSDAGAVRLADHSTPASLDGHSSRIHYLLTGGRTEGPIESVGDWWQARTQQLMDRGRTKTVRPQTKKPMSKRLAQSSRKVVDTSREFMESVTMPEVPLPENDYYDEHPIAVMAPSAVSDSDEFALTAQQVSWQDESGRSGSQVRANRLKTDIRTIKPTLGYAMRNIDASQLPEDFDKELEAGDYVPRQSSATVLQWAPTNLYHYPLYFEDPALERYGHSYHPLIQPFASTGRFATQFVGLPYQMALHPVDSREYSLGYYRPGECAPKKHYQIPFNEEATLVEIATIAGLILILP